MSEEKKVIKIVDTVKSEPVKIIEPITLKGIMKPINLIKGFIVKYPKVSIFILALISAVVILCTMQEVQLRGIQAQEAPLNSIEKIIVNGSSPRMYYNLEYSINGEVKKDSILCTTGIMAAPEVPINRSKKYKNPIVIYKNVQKDSLFLQKGIYLKKVCLPEDYKIVGE